MILTYLPYFDVYTNIQNPIDCSPSDYIVHVFVVRRIYELQILLNNNIEQINCAQKERPKKSSAKRKVRPTDLKVNCQEFLYS